MTEAKSTLLEQVRKYHFEASPPSDFIPGVTRLLPCGAVLDEDDRVALVEAALDMRIAAGARALKFEREFARILGRRKAHLTNSGSSANLLAISTLTSPVLEDRRLGPGDEVITVAAGFPTTVNPILQNGMVPVFVDTDLRTLNAEPEKVMAAKTAKTKAVVLAHTLGNPYRSDVLAEW